MTRGHPDWNIQTGALSGAAVDLAEHAGRTGYPDVFEGLGKVILYEFFGTDLGGWEALGSGTGNAAEIVTDRYYWKPASLRLTPGSDGNFNVSVRRDYPLINTRTMGFATLMTFLTGDPQLTLSLSVRDNGTLYDFQVRIDPSTGVIQILDDTATLQTIATVGDMGSSNRSWIYFKWTVDLENRRYRAIQVNDQRFDASDHVPRELPTGAQDHIETVMFLVDDTGGQDTAHFDFVVVTVDEP